MRAVVQRSTDQSKLLRQQAGQWLRRQREDRKLTQRDLAEKIGLRYYTFISQIESGQGRIPAEQYEGWANALELNPQLFVKTLMMYYDPHTYRLLFPDEPGADIGEEG
ncbi:MAG TPA: helix-turn-helix transcriptional regulator [Azospirillaceae bacterium]|nr:helix-turn-helix transcriptional regulator [Azospirillaceae bacterium]